MEVLFIIIVIIAVIFFLKFRKKEPGAKDIPNVIRYAAIVLAKTPQDPFITIDRVLFSHVENYVKNNRNVNILEQDVETLVFTVSISKMVYKVVAKKFIHDQLWIGAKILYRV